MASASDATLSSRRWDSDAWSCPDPARCVRCDSTIASPSTPGSVVVSFNQAAIEKHLQEDVQEEDVDEDRWFLMGCNRPYQYQPLFHEDFEDHGEDASKQKNEKTKDIHSESSDTVKDDEEEEYKDSEDEALLLDLEEDDRAQHCKKKFADIKKKRSKNASSSSDDSSSSGSDSTLSSSSSSSSESESDSSSSSDSSASSTSSSSSSSSSSSESSESSSSNSLSLGSSQVNLHNSNTQHLLTNSLDDAEKKHQNQYFDAVTDLMIDNQKEMLKNADYYLDESNIVFGESLLFGTTSADKLCGNEDQNTFSNLLINQNDKR